MLRHEPRLVITQDHALLGRVIVDHSGVPWVYVREFIGIDYWRELNPDAEEQPHEYGLNVFYGDEKNRPPAKADGQKEREQKHMNIIPQEMNK